MSPLVPLVMFGWIPVVLYLFKQLPARQALVVSFIAAWLFLPLAEYNLPGLPSYNKMSATCYGILLATIIYDAGRFSSFRFGWLDLPMLIWCVCPFASSITNGLGAYDGISAAVEQAVTWGLPYFLGRIYFDSLAGLRQLAIGIFAGGLIYIPLCLYETRMSVNLHGLIYGFTHPSANYLVSLRYGGYRPSVFMESGLMVGVWMMAATLIGIWLWKTKAIKQLWGIPISWLVIMLLVTFVLVKATGAYVLLVLGSFILFFAKWFRTAFPLLLLIAGISFYIYLGATGNFPGDQIVSYMSQVFDVDRVGSVKFRFDNEIILAEKARQSIIFGWGGFGRGRVYNEFGNDISITDSLWIITFGNNGLIGLSSLTASLLLPVVSFLWLHYPASSWSHPKVAPATVLVVALTLYMLDCILNAMINPIFALTCGGISGLVLKGKEKELTGGRLSVAQRYLVQGR